VVLHAHQCGANRAGPAACDRFLHFINSKLGRDPAKTSGKRPKRGWHDFC
jgi:hypothetical protein